MTYTKEECKKLWETENGGGITFDDIADCAVAWGLFSKPKIHPILKVSNQVLVSAGCEKYFEEEDDE